MRLRAAVHAAALFFPALVLMACEYSPDISERTIAYNQAIAHSTNNLFLLNAVRASEREPTYYSRNQANTASSTVTPTLSGTFPWGSSTTVTRSLTQNTGPLSGTTGFASVSTLTRALTKSALSLTSSLTGTEQNQLTLTNLDDQQSMNGLLSPISLQQISNYLQEGYSPEELDLLYVGSITVSKEILDRLPDAIAENCGAKAAAGTGFPAQQTYCRYFFGDGTAVRFHPWTFNGKAMCNGSGASLRKNGCFKFASLRAGSLNSSCFDAKTIADVALGSERLQSPPIDRPEEGEFTFINDPAMDNPTATGVQFKKTFTCFHQVLLALLALDFLPTDTPPKFLYRLPLEEAASNSRLFADLTQQKLQVSVKSTSVAVCKPADDMSLGYSGDAYVAAIFNQPKEPTSGDQTTGAIIATFTDKSATDNVSQEPPTTADAAKPHHRAPHKIAPEKPPKKSDCEKAADTANKAEPERKPPQIKYTTRSLEAIVYYLGQIIRRKGGEADAPAGTPVTFYNAADLEHPYFEALFDVEKGSPESDSVAIAESETGTYFVPSLCAGDNRYPGGCSWEYPDHASAQVLTLLNQIWGLNKTQTAAPIVPTVTVINP